MLPDTKVNNDYSLVEYKISINNKDLEEICLHVIQREDTTEESWVRLMKTVLSHISYCPDSVEDLADVYTRLVYLGYDRYPNNDFISRQWESLNRAYLYIQNKN
jgi:hypothetical protein